MADATALKEEGNRLFASQDYLKVDHVLLSFGLSAFSSAHPEPKRSGTCAGSRGLHTGDQSRSTERRAVQVRDLCCGQNQASCLQCYSFPSHCMCVHGTHSPLLLPLQQPERGLAKAEEGDQGAGGC